jgi:hypothetical protein
MQEVLKKRSDRVLSASYIAEIFKQKAVACGSYPDRAALLWYLRRGTGTHRQPPRISIEHAIVNDKEFKAILAAQPAELLLAQTNIFGQDLQIMSNLSSLMDDAPSSLADRIIAQFAFPSADISLHSINLMTASLCRSEAQAILGVREMTIRIPSSSFEESKARLLADLDVWIAPAKDRLPWHTIDNILAASHPTAKPKIMKSPISRPRTSESTSSSSSSAAR